MIRCLPNPCACRASLIGVAQMPGERNGMLTIKRNIRAMVTLFLLSLFTIIVNSKVVAADELPASGSSAILLTQNVPNFWDPRSLMERPAETPERIEFLSTDDFPPFAFRDKSERLTGFHVDLARALCEELQSSCSLRVKAFEALADALEADEGNAVIAGLAKTPELAGQFSFTDPYLRMPGRFVTRLADGAGLDGLQFAGTEVSVERGSRHAAFLRARMPEVVLREYDTITEAREALRSGDVGAHFGDGMSLSFWLGGAFSEGCCMFVPGPWLEDAYFGNGLRIAVRQDDAVLLEALNYGLRRLQEKGVYSELYRRYFPISFF
ncbi:transporter substrate-binding domain-containing protein [Pannonibacter sp.]|uniref:transporter substrate-binding domain-containing protein n=1 Tax=Pannonibacter sp. TaxID=1906786 RepID=UPI003F6EB823